MSWRVTWAKAHPPVVGVLVVVAVGLAIGVLFRRGYVTPEMLVEHRILIDVASKLVTAAVLAFGAVASYFRFFRGRTFSPRVNVNADVDVLPIDEQRNLHVLVLELDNVGSSAVWDINPAVDIQYHSDEPRTERNVRDWIRTAELPNTIAPTEMLDSGVKGQYVMQREVATDVWAVTYSINVTEDQGYYRFRVVTASNRLPERDDRPRQQTALS